VERSPPAGLSRELKRRNLLMVPHRFNVSMIRTLLVGSTLRLESSVSQFPAFVMLVIVLTARPAWHLVVGGKGDLMKHPPKLDHSSSVT
jgi:hypothetical protein